MATVKCYTRFLLILSLAFALSACAMAPKTPKQTMAATYVTIETLADSTLLAFQSGQIDRETTTKLYRKLSEAKAYVDLVVTVDNPGEKEGTQLEQARDLLVDVEAILEGATNE